MGILFCEACGASNRPESRFCGECGAAVQPDTDASPSADSGGPRRGSRARSARSSPPRRTEKRRPRARGARHQVRSAARAIARIQYVFFAIGVLFSLSFGLALNGVSNTDPDELSPGATAIVLAIFGAPMVVCFLGCWLAPRQPLPWALGLAGLASLHLVVEIVTNGFPGLLPILLAIACWGFVKPVLNLHRLMRDNPDDPAVVELRAGTKRKGRRRSTLLGDFGRAAMLLVGFLLVLVGGGYAISVVSTLVSNSAMAEADPDSASRDDQPDEPLEPILARFESAWRAGDFAAMGALYVDRLRGRRSARLSRRFEKRDLAPPLPALSDRQVVNYRRMQKMVTWQSERGPVELVFEFADGAWGMVALRLQ